MFYRKVTKDKTHDINKRVRFYRDRLLNDISFQVTPSLASYTYHKLHKQGHPGRPIISANGHYFLIFIHFLLIYNTNTTYKFYFTLLTTPYYI